MQESSVTWHSVIQWSGFCINQGRLGYVVKQPQNLYECLKKIFMSWSRYMFISSHQEGEFLVITQELRLMERSHLLKYCQLLFQRKSDTRGSHIGNYMVQLRSGSSHFHSVSLARICHVALPNCKGAKCNPTMCPEGKKLEMFDIHVYDHHVSQEWS